MAESPTAPANALRAAEIRCAVARGRFWKWTRFVDLATELVPELVTPEIVQMRDDAEAEFVVANLECQAVEGDTEP